MHLIFAFAKSCKITIKYLNEQWELFLQTIGMTWWTRFKSGDYTEVADNKANGSFHRSSLIILLYSACTEMIILEGYVTLALW